MEITKYQGGFFNAVCMLDNQENLASQANYVGQEN
jgi:hypothetical protein